MYNQNFAHRVLVLMALMLLKPHISEARLKEFLQAAHIPLSIFSLEAALETVLAQYLNLEGGIQSYYDRAK